MTFNAIHAGRIMERLKKSERETMLNHEPNIAELPLGHIKSKMYDQTYTAIITPSAQRSNGRSL
jgi:hypothetical protein